MNTLSLTRRAAIIRALVEGNSIRAAARLTGSDKDTVMRLAVEVGDFCSVYQDHKLVNLPCKRVEADEIWAFVGAKSQNATKKGHGDIWTYTALCSDSKLMLSWFIGNRTQHSAEIFMRDVASRLANRVQLTTDGHRMYLDAVDWAFGSNVDYAQLVKQYGPSHETGPGKRYSPPVCTGAIKEPIIGRPVKELVSTSYVERANLTMRMQMRRFTRLTNGFSKKAENHARAVSLHCFYYNFCRRHTTLTRKAKGVHTTPAMAAGLTDRVWTVEDLLNLMDPTRLLQ
jgi:IS1 family transposase